MNISKAQREMLRDEFRKVWVRRDGSIDEGMVDYCTKKASAFIEIGDRIIIMDKPNIQTSFCFGYGCQSAYDYDEAREAAENARHSEYMFIMRNLDGTEAASHMESIVGDTWWFEPWLDQTHYMSQSDDCRLGEVRWEHWHNRDRCISNGWRRLTDDEVKAYYTMCYEEQLKFLKRLKAYLKRYGTSKLHSWTYWADE